MSIKTKESLNCSCNGIYKCGLHSVPKFIKTFLITDYELLNPKDVTVTKMYGESMVKQFVSPCITRPFPEIAKDWWNPLLLKDIEDNSS